MKPYAFKSNKLNFKILQRNKFNLTLFIETTLYLEFKYLIWAEKVIGYF